MKLSSTLKFGVALVAVVPVICTASWLSAQYRESDQTQVPEGQFVATENGQIFVQEWGNADDPTLLMVHGTMAWSEFWDRTAEHLVQEGWHVTALDLPPFGYSDRVDDYTTKAQAVRIVEVAQQISDQPPIIVGHSFGAGPVMEAILSDPEVFSGAVVINAALGLDAPDKELPLALRPTGVRQAAVSLSMTNPWATKTLIQSFLTYPDTLDDKTVEMIQAPLTRDGTTAAYAEWSKELLAPSQARSRKSEAYADLEVPLGILWSELDKVTPLSQGEELARVAPHKVMTILPDSGHIPQIETPALFEQELAAMLRHFR